STCASSSASSSGLEGTHRAGATDAQHQALDHAESVIEIAALDIRGRQVQSNGEVEILSAAVDQQGRWFGQHGGWKHAAACEFFDLLQLENATVVEDAVQVSVQ